MMYSRVRDKYTVHFRVYPHRRRSRILVVAPHGIVIVANVRPLPARQDIDALHAIHLIFMNGKPAHFTVSPRNRTRPLRSSKRRVAALCPLVRPRGKPAYAAGGTTRTSDDETSEPSRDRSFACRYAGNRHRHRATGGRGRAQSVLVRRVAEGRSQCSEEPTRTKTWRPSRRRRMSREWMCRDLFRFLSRDVRPVLNVLCRSWNTISTRWHSERN